MQHRLLLVIAITGALGASREAAAACDVAGPYFGTGAQLPLGCPLHMYVGMLGLSPDPTSPPRPPITPTITALRNGTYVDVTGAYSTTSAELSVQRTLADCQGAPLNTMQILQTYQHYEIPLSGVQVGEEIGFDRGWFTGIQIVAAGPCAAPIMPMPACIDVPRCFIEPPFGDDVANDGCQARGGGSLAAGVALLGLLRRGPRRRRR